jgi:uncharacterized protein YjbI with pentapeptide repeats
MTSKELLERYAAGERDFSGITLVSGNLIRADLRGINLSNANLSNTSFIQAILYDADLSGIYMDGGDFTSLIYLISVPLIPTMTMFQGFPQFQS